MDTAELAAHRRTAPRVERRQWVVEDQRARLRREDAAQREATTLCLVELRRVSSLHALEADQPQRLGHPRADVTHGHPPLAQAERNVFEDALVGPEAKARRHEPEIAPLGRDLRDRLAVEADLAEVGIGEAGDHAQERRLSRAGRTDDAEELAGGDRHGDAAHRPRGAQELADAAQLERRRHPLIHAIRRSRSRTHRAR